MKKYLLSIKVLSLREVVFNRGRNCGLDIGLRKVRVQVKHDGNADNADNADFQLIFKVAKHNTLFGVFVDSKN